MSQLSLKYKVRLNQSFTFGTVVSKVYIHRNISDIHVILPDKGNMLLVCDRNTEAIARKIAAGSPCILEAGETAKNWNSIEAILRAAKEAGLGRDGVFIGIGGGVVSDMTAFAASVYMRGASVALVSTTLLGMVDAAVGGKTGFDLFGMKNFVGSFYPASLVFMPLESLETLPQQEWKSGMAELIKTAILDKEDSTFLDSIESLLPTFMQADFPRLVENEAFLECIRRSVLVKGRIVEADPKETGMERMLLNLGHTFGHALESSVGLGTISHGEAVAWGLGRAAELGAALTITPKERAVRITKLLGAFGYTISAPHPLVKNAETFIAALMNDKKKKNGQLSFIVPAQEGCSLVSLEKIGYRLLEQIIFGEGLSGGIRS